SCHITVDGAPSGAELSIIASNTTSRTSVSFASLNSNVLLSNVAVEMPDAFFRKVVSQAQLPLIMAVGNSTVVNADVSSAAKASYAEGMLSIARPASQQQNRAYSSFLVKQALQVAPQQLLSAQS